MRYNRGGAYLREYPPVILRMFLHSMVQLTAPLLVPYFICLVLGIGAGPGSFLATRAILSLIVTAAPLPGSVGASEGGFMALYGPLFGAGRVFSIMMSSRGTGFYGFLTISGLMTAYLQLRSRLRVAGEGKQQVIEVDIDR